MGKNLIFIPYAYKKGNKTGANIKSLDKQMDVYLKNCAVALLSARCYNDKETDIAIVTNIEVPEPYASIFRNNGILTIKQEFDKFVFDADCQWSLAFYKLCALKAVVTYYGQYEKYAFLDTDVFVQRSFNDIWAECDENIMMFDICHGLHVKLYQNILVEYEKFTGSKKMITHYGGEFFAANRSNSILFAEECEKIYWEMKDKNFNTFYGDEFISSIAADRMKSFIKNSGAYIFRFEISLFLMTCSRYLFNPVTVLHVPTAKEKGFIRLFDRYYAKGKDPDLNDVYQQLYLSSESIVLRIKRYFHKLKGDLQY